MHKLIDAFLKAIHQMYLQIDLVNLSELFFYVILEVGFVTGTSSDAKFKTIWWIKRLLPQLFRRTNVIKSVQFN